MQPGCIMLDLKGHELTQEEVELLQHPLVGGVILFARNYSSPMQLAELTKAIRLARPGPLLIAVDQEGGRVQRFREGFTILPPAQLYGELYQQDSIRAKRLAADAAWLMATELLAFDIDFSFAPVLDLQQGISEVIGNRSFHKDPEVVTELALAFFHGMQQAGMIAVGKHFPGHGSVVADSHTDIPVDERSFAEIEREDLIPFARLVAGGISAIMPAHIIYPNVDDKPVGFSSIWLQKMLREQLKFSGAIISDDLSMHGATVVGNIIARAEQALSAGCDLLLVCNDRDAAIYLLDHMPATKAWNPQRLLALRARKNKEYDDLHKMQRLQLVRQQLESLQ